MSVKNLDSVNPMLFMQKKKERENIINASQARPLPKSYAINELSKSLHPKRQYVKVSEIKEWDADTKTYTLVPDEESGTKKLAYFKAGAYICVDLEVDGAQVSRPYSISSSPKEALEGKYMITIKRVPEGMASNYILDYWTVGTKAVISAPLGEFVYLPMRDGKTVIGAAGGSGITPFLSFARAIANQDENFELILLYGSKNEEEILFKEELDAIAASCPKVKVMYVLSEEKKEGYEHGFITADLIKRVAPAESYSVFLCGPQAMYHFLDEELMKLNLERKWIRRELQGELHNPKKLADYPGGTEIPETVSIQVTVNDVTKTILARTEDTILQSLEKNGIAAPAHCRSGECGWCHSLLLSGKVYCPKQTEHRREADRKFGYIHPCCTFPISDIAIKVSRK